MSDDNHHSDGNHPSDGNHHTASPIATTSAEIEGWGHIDCTTKVSFFGKIIISFEDGRVVYVKEVKTHKLTKG